MELASRKEKILSAVVEQYIASGEPIGSKALLTATGLDVSSATIRNELKALDDVAYVRFASVYRQFKDINTFMRELNKLLEEK